MYTHYTARNRLFSLQRIQYTDYVTGVHGSIQALRKAAMACSSGHQALQVKVKVAIGRVTCHCFATTIISLDHQFMVHGRVRGQSFLNCLLKTLLPNQERQIAAHGHPTSPDGL